MFRDPADAAVVVVSANANGNDADGSVGGRQCWVAEAGPPSMSSMTAAGDGITGSTPVNYCCRIATCRGWTPHSNACGFRSLFRLAVV